MKRPPYIRFGTESFLWLTEQKPRKQNEILSKMRGIFDGILKNDSPVIDDSNQDGRMLASFERFVSAGLSAYKAHNDSLPNGKPNGKPNGPITTTRPEGDIDIITKQQTTHSSGLTPADIGLLLSKGYQESEIQHATQVVDWQKMRGGSAVDYIQGVMNNIRKQKNNAQQYEQRDYADQKEKPEEMIARLEAEGV